MIEETALQCASTAGRPTANCAIFGELGKYHRHQSPGAGP